MIWVTWIHLDVNFFSVGKSIIIVHCVISWSSKYRTLVREDPGIQWTDKLYVDFQLHDALALITIVLLKGQVYKFLIINHRIISHQLSAEATICLGLSGGASGKESASQYGRCKRHCCDPWVGKIPCKIAPYSKYSCLENSMLRGAWWAAVHGAAKSQIDWARADTHTICSGRKRHINNQRL